MNEQTKNERVKLTLELNADLNRRLERIAEDIDGSKSEVLRRAIALFELANEAKHKGRRLGVIEPDGQVITTVVGV